LRRSAQKVKNFEVEVREKIEPEELLDVIPDYDGVVIRSRTKIGRKALERASRLRVIGRAGIGDEDRAESS
jgi:D-3-phosphoglycerate dehydrogenase